MDPHANTGLYTHVHVRHPNVYNHSYFMRACPHFRLFVFEKYSLISPENGAPYCVQTLSLKASTSKRPCAWPKMAHAIYQNFHSRHAFARTSRTHDLNLTLVIILSEILNHLDLCIYWLLQQACVCTRKLQTQSYSQSHFGHYFERNIES